MYLDNDGNNDFIPAQIEIKYNDFDQSTSGIYIKRPISIGSTNLSNTYPIFVDTLSKDFHLQDISPLLDKGYNNAPGIPTKDKDGNSRIKMVG